jgi:hypothetical protein
VVAICEWILPKIGIAIGIYLTCYCEALTFSKLRDFRHLSQDIFNYKVINLNLFTAIDAKLQRTIFLVWHSIVY